MNSEWKKKWNFNVIIVKLQFGINLCKVENCEFVAKMHMYYHVIARKTCCWFKSEKQRENYEMKKKNTIIANCAK